MHSLKVKMAISMLMVLVLLPGIGCSQNSFEGINPNQPISIGETIYSQESEIWPGVNFFSTARISYVYLGIDNNSIILKQTDYTGNSRGRNREENTIVMLPLNGNKQVLLEVSPDTKILHPVNLVITITDNSDKITVEEFKPS